MGGYILIALAGVFLAVMFRLQHGEMDHDRITRYVEARGGRLIDFHWVPFGPGWVGKNDDRIYEVRYLDSDGNRHHAYCKTSGWSGVYFTEDVAEPLGCAGRSTPARRREPATPR